jgi:hypothetical protein
MVVVCSDPEEKQQAVSEADISVCIISAIFPVPRIVPETWQTLGKLFL